MEWVRQSFLRLQELDGPLRVRRQNLMKDGFLGPENAGSAQHPYLTTSLRQVLDTPLRTAYINCVRCQWQMNLQRPPPSQPGKSAVFIFLAIVPPA
jgi:hypothetical protein